MHQALGEMLGAEEKSITWPLSLRSVQGKRCQLHFGNIYFLIKSVACSPIYSCPLISLNFSSRKDWHASFTGVKLRHGQMQGPAQMGTV